MTTESKVKFTEATSASSRVRYKAPVSGFQADVQERVTELVQEPGARYLDTGPKTVSGASSEDIVGTRRRMPEGLRKCLIKVQGGRFYLPAAYRLVWFREECPDWSILTDLIEGGQQAGFATVKATIMNPEGRVIATGIKTETQKDFPAGWVEKAETGSVARALSMAGFGTQFMPELDDESARPADSPLPRRSGRHEGSIHIESAPRESARRTITPEAAVGRDSGGASDVWGGPGLCPNCHAPSGKRHGRSCSALRAA